MYGLGVLPSAVVVIVVLPCPSFLFHSLFPSLSCVFGVFLLLVFSLSIALPFPHCLLAFWKLTSRLRARCFFLPSALGFWFPFFFFLSCLLDATRGFLNALPLLLLFFFFTVLFGGFFLRCAYIHDMQRSTIHLSTIHLSSMRSFSIQYSTFTTTHYPLSNGYHPSSTINHSFFFSCLATPSHFISLSFHSFIPTHLSHLSCCYLRASLLPNQLRFFKLQAQASVKRNIRRTDMVLSPAVRLLPRPYVCA
ncbi:hypothetical protein BDZ97DRAFT_1145192 [Flammula alnicola]|nr:hypothetical protein BDZ97DRAFT_1145192 [Flammula alnicola]